MGSSTVSPVSSFFAQPWQREDVVGNAEDRPPGVGTQALAQTRHPRRALDLHGAIRQLKIRSSLYDHGAVYSHPDPRVRAEMLANAAKQLEADRESDERVIGTLIFAAGMMGTDDGGRRLIDGIAAVHRNATWLNVMWKQEHFAETLGPLIDMAWREYAGMRFVNHMWPGKQR
jgi:hypothetical protein